MNSADNVYGRQTEPLLIVLSGPSGVGKDAVVRRIQERSDAFHFVITATTRAIRPGEEHGKDYFFVDVAGFERMIQENELLEYATVYGEYKGIPKQQVREAFASGKDVILRLDVQGAETVRNTVPEVVSIFLMAEDEETLVERLTQRKTDTGAQLEKRIPTARKEIQRLHEFDYVVVNAAGKLDETVHKIFCIITAEKCRVHQREVIL